MSEKDEESFLSRWSRRKKEDLVDSEHAPTVEQEQETLLDETSENDDDSPPVWQQKDSEPEEKKRALAALFKQAEFNDVDHMNEYDEDFTSFTGLGDIVTQEMKRMLRLAEENTRPKDNDVPQGNDTEITQDSETEHVEVDNDKEDTLA